MIGVLGWEESCENAPVVDTLCLGPPPGVVGWLPLLSVTAKAIDWCSCLPCLKLYCDFPYLTRARPVGRSWAGTLTRSDWLNPRHLQTKPTRHFMWPWLGRWIFRAELP